MVERRLMRKQKLINCIRTALLAIMLVEGSLSAIAQEGKDSTTITHPIPDKNLVEPIPFFLNSDYFAKQGSFENSLKDKRIANKRLSNTLLNSLIPPKKTFQLSKEFNFATYRQDLDAPFLQTRHATGMLSWQPTDKVRLYSSGTFGLGQDLLMGVQKDYGWNMGADFKLNDQMTAHLQGGWQKNFGIMPTTLLSGHINWQASDRLRFSTGIGYRQIQTNYFENKNLSLNGSLRYEVIDNIYINGYGSYPIYNSSHTNLNTNVFPRGSGPMFGGSMEIKLSDKFGFAVGAEREYNIWKRRWETNYYAYPVFYGNKK